MKIGIDASRAFEKNRTGIEEYSYQVIKHLMGELKDHQVVLYIRTPPTPPLRKGRGQGEGFDFKLPNNWRIKIIRFPYLWTQVGLSLELLVHPVDTLFIPAHVVPCIHPKNTIVTIHGLEYEFCPKAYSWWARLYMRWSIKESCRWTKTIIAVSENTKRDLIKLYKVPEGKIKVIYEGVNNNLPLRKRGNEGDLKNSQKIINPSPPSAVPPFLKEEKYLLFIGRLEERKNICGIIEAYRILKEKYKIPHKLVLAGKFGYGSEKIKREIDRICVGAIHELPKNRAVHEPPLQSKNIILAGYVDEEEKWELLKKSDVFLFPTFYEGFGLPILEAQSVGVPVVASNNSSIPEVVSMINFNHPPSRRGDVPYRDRGVRDYFHTTPSPSSERRGGLDCSALLVNPQNPSEIAESAYKLISDKNLRDDIINRGYENVRRFSWEKCAEEIAKILTK